MKHRLVPDSSLDRVLLFSALIGSFLMGLCAFFPLQNELSILTLPHLRVSEVSDQYENGNSTVHLDSTGTSLKYNWHLKPGFKWPFAGIKLHLSENALAGIDVEAYRKFKIHLKTSNSDGLRFTLKSPEVGVTDSAIPTSYIYHEIEFFPGQIGEFVEFNFKELTHPNWWRNYYHLNATQSLEKISPLQEIEILNGYSPDSNVETLVEIYSLELLGENYILAQISGSIAFLLFGTLLIRRFERLKKQRRQLKVSESNRSQALKNYKEIEIKPHEAKQYEAIISWLKENYTHSDLNLEHTAQSVGVQSRIISQLLTKNMGLNFKSYLNELRLNEAHRLIETTTATLAEISESVGYNNQSHFNRLFKEKFGKSPGQVR